MEKEKKKKKNEKKAETQKAKAEEQANRQKGWQSFAKKSAKKGVSIPGMAGEHETVLFTSVSPDELMGGFRWSLRREYV